MMSFSRKIVTFLCILALTGCATSGDGLIHVAATAKTSASGAVNNGITFNFAGYTDARNNGNPRKLGDSTQAIGGMSGKEILLDRDASALVNEVVQQSLLDAGFQLSENASSRYELSGVVKELRFDVKFRDEVAVMLETSIKDRTTGETVWTGLSIQKEDRFAGMSGNNTSDIAKFLKKQLGLASKKIVTNLTANLTAFHPAPAPVVADGGMTGQLKLSVLPERAKVYVDGIYFGLAPLQSELAAGVHDVSVKLDGYVPASEKIAIRKGSVTELEISLQR